MSKNRADDDLAEWVFSRATLGPTFFWLVIWAICNFNPWVGFGLFFAWSGSVGLFHKGKKRRRGGATDEEDRGFQAGQGGQGEPVALADQSEEARATPTVPLHRQVIADASVARTRLEAAASVGEGELGSKLRNMVAMAREVETSLDADPSRLSDVQRLFTYYLPATADLLTARGALAGSGDTQRLAEIDAMIGKLDVAFSDFAQRLKGHDARSLDLDLRLLDQSLDEEFMLKVKA